MTAFDVGGRAALVTGGGSGIGRATCRVLAESGARVAVLDRDLGAAERVAEEIGGIAVAVDVADPASVEGAVGAVVAAFGRLDIAVNAAGVPSIEPVRLHETTFEGWTRVTSINLGGVYSCMRHEIAAMLEVGGGAIVNVSSMLGLIGQVGSSAYCAAKSGVIGLTRVAALEYGRDGIRVNAIAPGYIETPMVTNRLAEIGQSVDELGETTPMGRVGSAEEMARTIVFLVSGDSGYTTGQVIAADGGFTAR
jgi:NAD(P)-dependent dehydrogenase (short-subunit alcohol dehydrogenase family)